MLIIYKSRISCLYTFRHSDWILQGFGEMDFVCMVRFLSWLEPLPLQQCDVCSKLHNSFHHLFYSVTMCKCSHWQPVSPYALLMFQRRGNYPAFPIYQITKRFAQALVPDVAEFILASGNSIWPSQPTFLIFVTDFPCLADVAYAAGSAVCKLWISHQSTPLQLCPKLHALLITH